MNVKWNVAIGLAAIATLTGLLGWEAIRFERQPWFADVRAAYNLKLLAGVNAPDLDEIEKGRAPRFVFEASRFHGPSLFVWPRASLERPGDCLEARFGRPPDPDCVLPDTLTRNANRLVFSPDRDESRQIGVHARPLGAGETETFGAVFGVSGEIGIGRDFRDASRFTIEIESRHVRDPPSPHLDVETEPDEGEGTCQPAQAARPDRPLLVAVRPAIRLRPCTFTSKDHRRLTLLQLPLGWLQGSRWLSALRCRALLVAHLGTAAPPDFAGCLWANWNEPDRPAAVINLFQSLGAGAWAIIQ